MSEKKEIVEIKQIEDEEEAGTSADQKKSTKKPPPAKSSLKQLKKQLKDQNEKLKIANKERDEFKDKYLRNLAEIDNFRKRMQKEKEDYQKYVLSEFLLELLQIHDNLERALNAKKDTTEEESIISGIEMIYKQFQTLLAKYHVVEIESLNRPFDPTYHQAISKVEKEGVEEPEVIEVYQKGFLYHEKLLRPAFVKVAIPQEEIHEDEEE